MFKLILNWFVKSSINPEAISLTIKGLIPFLVLLGLNETVLQGTADSLVTVIVGIGQLVTALIALYGFIRKVALSLKKNK